MDKNKLWKWSLLVILVLWSLTLSYPLQDVKNEEGAIVKKGRIKLGLDLTGKSTTRD